MLSRRVNVCKHSLMGHRKLQQRASTKKFPDTKGPGKKIYSTHSLTPECKPFNVETKDLRQLPSRSSVPPAERSQRTLRLCRWRCPAVLKLLSQSLHTFFFLPNCLPSLPALVSASPAAGRFRLRDDLASSDGGEFLSADAAASASSRGLLGLLLPLPEVVSLGEVGTGRLPRGGTDESRRVRRRRRGGDRRSGRGSEGGLSDEREGGWVGVARRDVRRWRQYRRE